MGFYILCSGPDLNWRHLPLQGSALPTELPEQLACPPRQLPEQDYNLQNYFILLKHLNLKNLNHKYPLNYLKMVL
jgi:hypothetical protein